MAAPKTTIHRPGRRATTPVAALRGGGAGVDGSPRMVAQRRQLRSIFGDAGAIPGNDDVRDRRSFVYTPGTAFHAEGGARAGVAQREKEYVVDSGTGSLHELSDDDETSRVGWLFYGLDTDFVWVRKENREGFERQYPSAKLFTSIASDEELEKPKVEKKENKDAKLDEETPDVPFDERLVLTIHTRQESKGDHQYVIVCIAGGENLKIELGSGGHSMAKSRDISPTFGTPVNEYAPNSGLTAGAVVQRFKHLESTVKFDFTDYNCVRYAGDFVSTLGTKKGRDEIDDLFGK